MTRCGGHVLGPLCTYATCDPPHSFQRQNPVVVLRTSIPAVDGRPKDCSSFVAPLGQNWGTTARVWGQTRTKRENRDKNVTWEKKGHWTGGQRCGAKSKPWGPLSWKLRARLLFLERKRSAGAPPPPTRTFTPTDSVRARSRDSRAWAGRATGRLGKRRRCPVAFQLGILVKLGQGCPECWFPVQIEGVGQPVGFKNKTNNKKTTCKY